MAHVNFDGLNLRLTLDRMERTATMRKEVVIPRENIAGVVHAPDIWELVQHRITLMGIGYPGVALIGVAETRHARDFCILYRHGPGLAIALKGHRFNRILLSMPNEEAWPLYIRLREITGHRDSADRAT